MSVDVLILAGDRAEDLPGAIGSTRSLGGSLGRVIVLDSACDGEIREAAERAGAEVADDPTHGAWGERNAALAAAGLGGDWLLLLHPDERITPALAREILALDGAGSGPAAYALRIRTLLHGRALRFGGFGRVRSLRLVRRDRAVFATDRVGATLVAEGAAGRLRGKLLRVRRETVSSFLDRGRLTARAEAERAVMLAHRGERDRRPRGGRFGATGRFFSRYFFRLGFLDGRAGFHAAMLDANVCYMTRMLADEGLGRIEHERGVMVPGAAKPYGRGSPGVASRPDRALFPVSVIVLTRDEEINIDECLECLGFSDDIVVYDSLSEDRTVELARRFENVRVIERRFDNWSAHQNWAVQNIGFKHPWVLYIDADERVTPELAEELRSLADPECEESAFRMRRKDMFMGRWIRHATLYPTWIVRMFRPTRIHWERLVNPVAVVEGKISDVGEHLIHYPLSKGTRQWFDRHNSYSSFEAEELLKVRSGQRRKLRGLIGRGPNERRAVAKDMFYRIPFRPQVKWLYYMLWKFAWLDGMPGITYARMQCLYEYMISIKARELARERRAGRR